jgi:hypothetical protein
VIFAGVFAVGMAFVPETLPRIVIARAVKEDPSAADEAETAVAKADINVLTEMRFVTTMAMRIMFTEPIVTFLGPFLPPALVKPGSKADRRCDQVFSTGSHTVFSSCTSMAYSTCS